MPKPPALETEEVQGVSPEKAELQFTDLEKKVIEEIAFNFQDMIQSSAKTDHKVKMQYNEDIDSYVIEVSDQNSGEVVFQIPPEDMLMIGHKMKELVGLLFDEKT
ncbi:MAG: flagellar protein FlaG [bacterium]